jgi:hypothetical protein
MAFLHGRHAIFAMVNPVRRGILKPSKGAFTVRLFFASLPRRNLVGLCKRPLGTLDKGLLK